MNHHANNDHVHQLLPEEEAYITLSSHPTNARHALAYALAFNTLQPAWIVAHLADDVRFESQSVRKAIEGKEAVVAYLQARLEALAQVGEERRCRYEVGSNHQEETPGVIVYQRDGRFSRGLGERVLWIDLFADDAGKIVRIFAVTTSPPPAFARGTGIFPGVDAAVIEQEMARLPALLPWDSRLDFKVFTQQPGTAFDEVLRQSAVAVAGEMPNAQAFISAVDTSNPQIMEVCRAYGIMSLPTLIVEHGNEVVLRLSGPCPQQKLKEKLANVLECPREGDVA